MKCLACDVILSDKEAVRKSVTTGEFIDLCDDCFEPIKEVVPTVDGPMHETDFPDDEEEQGDHR